jgi:hypothetical protein
MSTLIVDGPGTVHGAPERSLQQRLEALGRANEIRTGRARLKREIKAGRKLVASLLLDPPKLIESMKIVDLLLAAPKLGRVKVNKALSHCNVSPMRSVGTLTERQRRELMRCLTPRA